MNSDRQSSPVDAAALAERMLADPVACFDASYARMHSLERDVLESVQLAGLKHRFGQLRDRVPMLKKLADEAGIDHVDNLEDVIPLLFTHTVYKSYPVSLLEKGRFKQLTQWLQKLTTVDLSAVDASGCQGIDDWIALLESETPLKLLQSSGTSGSVSFLPRTGAEAEKHFLCAQIGLFELAGQTPPLRDRPLSMHAIHGSFRRGTSVHLRLPDLLLPFVCGGDESKLHALYPYAQSADLMFLAGRLRAAEARGELDRLQLSPALQERRREFEQMQATMGTDLMRFYDEVIARLKGERIYMTGTWNVLYKLAQDGLAKGMERVFSLGSVLNTGGGAKGQVVPPGWEEDVKRFFGVSHLNHSYGMSELMANNKMCEHGRYHIEPWAILFVLDPDTGEPLPRVGTQTGRAAFYDLQAETYWGGFVTGDEVSVDWSSPCACGRHTPHIAREVERYSAKRGGDDKISCAAAPEAHDAALDFLNGSLT